MKQEPARRHHISRHRSGYEAPEDRRAEAVAISAWALFHDADEIITDDLEATEQTAKVMGKTAKITQAREPAEKPAQELAEAAAIA